MRIFLALLLLTVPCMGAPKAPKAPGVSRASMSVPIKKVGDKFHGKVGNVDFEVGAIVSNKIKPQLKLVKWGEDTLTVNFQSMGNINKTGATCNGSTVTFVFPAGKLNVYVTDDGHIEYEGVFNSVPLSSVQLTLTGWENFDFFYQPALTAQEIADGCVRPENVVGSYAVYHKTKVNNQYQTGKAFHIFRPCWIAADGQRLWITQTIVNGVWTLSWNKSWTDAAAKPLILDPTIGWTSAGATSASWGTGYSVAGSVSELTPIGTNVLNNISFYGTNASYQEMDSIDVWLCGDSNGYAGTRLTTVLTGSPLPASPAWVTTAGDFNYTLTASTRTHAVYLPTGNYPLTIYYDNNISGNVMALNYSDPSNATFQNDATWDGRRMSVYLTYTASGGGATPAPAPLIPQVLIWEN